LQRPDLCHREKEFFDLTSSVIQRLERVYENPGHAYRALVMTGSGTAAVEAMISSLAPKAGKTLVIANGVYGERAATMLSMQGKAHVLLKQEWTDAPDLRAAEDLLTKDSEIKKIFVVHHETTTGRLNDLASIGALAKKYKKPLLIDAVSSFGAEDIQLTEWNIEALAGAANKCLHGVPGIAFVLVRSEILIAQTTQSASLYFDLWQYAKGQGSGVSPFTQSVQAMNALDAALTEFDSSGGWKVRHLRYKALQARVRATLKELGIKDLLSDPESSSVVLAGFQIPTGKTYAALHAALKAKSFTVYAGQAKLEGEIFRISTMGDLHDSDIEELCTELRNALR
jgi:2-aminoethylphosphonate-pyruvate transaminase